MKRTKYFQLHCSLQVASLTDELLNSDTAADSKLELVNTLLAELERCEWPASLEWVLHRSAALQHCRSYTPTNCSLHCSAGRANFGHWG